MAGANGYDDDTNQLNSPHEFDIDDDNQSIIIAVWEIHRIVEWKMGEMNSKVIACDRGKGNRLDQQNYLTDVLIDQETNSLLIAD